MIIHPGVITRRGTRMNVKILELSDAKRVEADDVSS